MSSSRRASRSNRATRLLLNKAKRQGLSDHKIAKAIDRTPQAISRYRRANTHMSDTTCLAVAVLVGVQPQVALLLLHADRSPDPEVAELLRKAALVLLWVYHRARANKDGKWQKIRSLMHIPSRLKSAARRKASPRKGR